MSAIFSSIDEMLKNAKDEAALLTSTLNDRIFALETELTLHKSLTAAATLERDKYMRLATKLITQFGTVEKVFSEAKEMALALTHEIEPSAPEAPPQSPSNAPERPPEPTLVATIPEPASLNTQLPTFLTPPTT